MWKASALLLLVACKEPPPPDSPPAVETGTVDDTSTTPKPVGGPPSRLAGEISAASADARIDAADDVHFFGSRVAAAGDVDGDGIGDVLLGAPTDTNAMYYGDLHGQAWLVPGGALAGITTVDAVAAASVEGTRALDRAGWSLTGLGDWNKDGFDDFAVGALGGPETNARVAVVYGPFTGDVRLDAAETLLCAPEGTLGGAALIGHTDFTGDGNVDLVVASITSYVHSREIVWIIAEPIQGTVELDDIAAARLEFPAPMHMTIAAAHAGDLDGDGLSTLAVAASLPGQLYLFDAPLLGDLGPEAASSALTIGEELDLATSISDAGDSDGDGYSELPIGFQNHEDGAGIAYLIGQPADPRGDLATEARATLRHDEAAGVGIDIAFVGDLDGDGLDDLAVSGTSDDVAADAAGDDTRGVVYLLYGPILGEVDLASADAKIETMTGYYLGHVGDLDGDGYPDLAIGATGANGREGASGSVYLFLGGTEP